MKNKKKIYVIGLTLMLAFVLTGFGCKQDQDKKDEESLPKVNITMWGLWDEQDVFAPFASAYKKANPHVTIEYRKYAFGEYEQTIVDSLAAGKGPDIWLIHNTWLPKHKEKLTPMPEGVMSPYEYENVFVDVAYSDFVAENNIYGLPLSVDTMALYYNKDLFNTAAIPAPPTTWNQFKENVKSLTEINEFGDITRAGAALGTAQNVNRAVDLLYLLMIQNGTQMTDEDNMQAMFDSSATTADGESYQPGLDALIFYTDFANPKKSVYTWNPNMSYSPDAFIEEKTAMMFNYSYQNEVIKSKAPRLNYGVAAFPQIDGSPKRYDFANYWGFVVSNNSANKDVAWDFLTYLGQQENIKSYTETTQRPASRRDVLTEQLQNPELKTFAEQALTAQSWHQADPSLIEGVFTNMIESVALGETEASEALSDAVDRVSIIMNQ